MKLSLLGLIFPLHFSLSFAALCDADTLLALGSADTLPETFILKARLANGTTLPIVNDAAPLPGGFFLPVRLGDPDISPDDFTVPLFTLQGSTLYAAGGTVFSTMAPPVLYPLPLYISADSSQQEETFAAFNATCDGVAEQVVRFNSLGLLTIASAAINGSFVPGTPLASPILKNVLTLGTSVDLLIVPHNSP